MARRKINSWSWKRVRFRERQAFLYVDGKLTMLKKKKGSDAGDREDNNKRLLRGGSRMKSE